MPIAINDPVSWPNAITDALEAALPDLRSYHEHRARTNAERETDPNNIKWYTDYPRNPFRAARDTLADMIDEHNTDALFLAWHSTRLCDDEMEYVRKNGMFLLSPETFAARVLHRLNARDIPITIADRILANNQAANERRVGQIWFFFTRRPGGLRDLLGFWGGEALYRGHQDDPETGRVLEALGTPCVIELAIPRPHIRTYCSLGMNIVRTFELLHGLKDENPPDCEGHTRQVIPPEQVLRIITPDDEDFTAITAERD